MANIKISELTEKTAPHKDDLLVIADMENDLSKSVKYGTIRPYKVYEFLPGQTGTSAPSVTVLKNELGGTVVWTRSSTGVYLGTLAGAFPAGKTYSPQSGLARKSGDDTLYYLDLMRISDDVVQMNTLNSSLEPADELMNGLFQIFVYN